MKKTPKYFFLLIHATTLVACSPVDSTDDESTNADVQPGTYILDGSRSSTLATHEEWALSVDGSMVIRHFTWNSVTAKGCYDSQSYSDSWTDTALTDTSGKIVFTFSGRAQVRSACDSAWRDTSAKYSGKRTYMTRPDSLGFDFLDSTSTWRVMQRM